MQRQITRFHLDAEGHWLARLDCHHDQHVRHHPPLFERPWVLSESGRASRVGMALACVRCDDFEWPDGLAVYRSTPVFDESSVPAGLRKAHATRRGVWGHIVVLAGALDYVIEGEGDASASVTRLVAGGPPGIVVPELRHHVALCGPVRFRVDFHRPAA